MRPFVVQGRCDYRGCGDGASAPVKIKCGRHCHSLICLLQVRGESRFLQEWLTWHLFVGYSHIVVYYEDPDDGTLDGK